MLPTVRSIVVFAPVEVTLDAASKFPCKGSLYSAAAQRSSNAGAVRPVIRIGRTNTKLFCFRSIGLSFALFVFLTVHFEFSFL